mmetsp:Transcript_19199/g.26856  ORF Transcript_19199/g.26856 Transcript_19199/m.26856 type:complete len:136 (-) Transcript_19199:286-693(-)
MTVSINAFMLWFMVAEAILIILLLTPIKLLNRITIKMIRSMLSNRFNSYVYSFLTMVALFCGLNLYSAYSRYHKMKREKAVNGIPAAMDVFYKSQRDLYLNGLTLYLWIVVMLLISMHERNDRRMAEAEEEKKNQ